MTTKLTDTARATVESVLSKWEEEYRPGLGEEARSTLTLLFTTMLDEAVNITIEETMKSSFRRETIRRNKMI
jgi:hypothetical protein